MTALRLARPSSPWARRLYRGDRLARARARHAPSGRLARLGSSVGDLVAGAPSDRPPRER